MENFASDHTLIFLVAYRFQANASVQRGIIFNSTQPRNNGSACIVCLSKIVFTTRPQPFARLDVEEIVRSNERRENVCRRERERERERERTETTGPLSCRSSVVRLPAVTSPLFTPTPSCNSPPCTFYFVTSVPIVQPIRPFMAGLNRPLAIVWSCQTHRSIVPFLLFFLFIKPFSLLKEKSIVIPLGCFAVQGIPNINATKSFHWY